MTWKKQKWNVEGKKGINIEESSSPVCKTRIEGSVRIVEAEKVVLEKCFALHAAAEARTLVQIAGTT